MHRNNNTILCVFSLVVSTTLLVLFVVVRVSYVWVWAKPRGHPGARSYGGSTSNKCNKKRNGAIRIDLCLIQSRPALLGKTN
jgi:hypothetical protein